MSLDATSKRWRLLWIGRGSIRIGRFGAGLPSGFIPFGIKTRGNFLPPLGPRRRENSEPPPVKANQALSKNAILHRRLGTQLFKPPEFPLKPLLPGRAFLSQLREREADAIPNSIGRNFRKTIVNEIVDNVV
ncbi:hypothetical protein IVB22_32850 [Bradyrhizobium sp. 190]|uniref:hypothetical protein n=1 Tax=Bradyrhizobium sp. 190 TaxID=2782658 RepID=UPI001FFBEDE5|nr:hypothetical protein [Bradyrhizobium sp. 190]MCK1517211.1 hypothetical protein [Bradyrhizobium sp. 190]